MMKAIVLKKVSPLVDKDSVLIKRGKFGILEDYDKKEKVKVTISGILGDKTFICPNYYPWESVENMKDYYKIIE